MRMGHFSCHCLACMAAAEPERLVCDRCGGVLGFAYDAGALAADPARIVFVADVHGAAKEAPVGVERKGRAQSGGDVPVRLYFDDGCLYRLRRLGHVGGDGRTLQAQDQDGRDGSQEARRH